MTATVRFDDQLSKKLEELAAKFHKSKSDVIRDAIAFYVQSVEEAQRKRMLEAVEKVKEADKKEYDLLEGTLDDGLER